MPKQRVYSRCPAPFFLEIQLVFQRQNGLHNRNIPRRWTHCRYSDRPLEGGPLMAKNGTKLTYTFVNPNTPKAFENTLKKILIDKLLSNPPKSAPMKT